MRPEIGEIIDYLDGTCQTLDEAVQVVLGEDQDSTCLTQHELQHIDESIFCCNGCGWWSEISNMSEEEEGCCIDCAGDV